MIRRRDGGRISAVAPSFLGSGVARHWTHTMLTVAQCLQPHPPSEVPRIAVVCSTGGSVQEYVSARVANVLPMILLEGTVASPPSIAHQRLGMPLHVTYHTTNPQVIENTLCRGFQRQGLAEVPRLCVHRHAWFAV